VWRGAGLVIVEVREEVKMQQKPGKQNKARVRGYHKWRCTKKIKKERGGVWDKKGSAYGNGGGAKNTDGGVESKNFNGVKMLKGYKR